MPPTPATAFAVTLELPPAAAELDEAESEEKMQVGALTVVLPLLSIAVPLELSANMQGFPPAFTLPAVAIAVIIGADDMNMEVNGSDC